MANAAKEVITESSDKKKRQSVYSKAGLIAFNKARSSGVPVCFTEGTKVFRNGRKTCIGQINPPVKLVKKVFSI